MSAEWIAVDWGTTRLRAYAMDAEGAALDRAESAMGMGGLTPEGYESALLDLAGRWLAPDRATPVVICGMAGARQGWAEAPYLATGRPLADIAAHPTPVTTLDRRLAVRILPGVMQTDPPDVMRGEETQLLGLLHRDPGFDGLVCLPGTHSKWARVAAGAVNTFHTYMTGELFAALAAHTVLRHSVGDAGWDDAAFRAEILDAASGGLTRRLFSLRARHLLENSDKASIRARLSGMLIGAEIADALIAAAGRPVRLLAGGDLGDRYALALGLVGADFDVIDTGEATLDGLRAAHRLMGAGK